MRLIDADTLNFTCTADEDYKCQKIVDCNCCPFHTITSFEIENEPTVQAVPTWIPVSERLPNDEEYVLVCYADGSIRTAYYYIDTESYPPEFRDCCETGWYDYNEDYMYQDVIAWMPLPEPYKVERNKE